MAGKAPDDRYAPLIRRLLAGEIEPEQAAREAADLFRQERSEIPSGFTLSFADFTPAEAERLERFTDLLSEEILRRITSGEEDFG